jgi:hypothetical protein
MRLVRNNCAYLMGRHAMEVLRMDADRGMEYQIS